MPPRKRHKRELEHPDPLVRFGRALKEREVREKAEQARKQAEQAEAKRRAILAAEHAASLAKAHKELARAIDAVKSARATRSRVDVADAAYRAAKARVLELETGTLPAWAPGARHSQASDEPVDPDEHEAETAADEAGATDV